MFYLDLRIPINLKYLVMDAKKDKLGADWIKKIVLREEEVMAMFGWSKCTVARLRRNGELPHSKIGGSSFYQPKELKKMLKNKMVKPKL